MVLRRVATDEIQSSLTRRNMFGEIVIRGLKATAKLMLTLRVEEIITRGSAVRCAEGL